MSGLELMKKRLDSRGGNANGSNAVGKYRSFLAALDNGYQTEEIIYEDRTERCIINESSITENKDEKMISADFATGLEDGSVFYWTRTDHNWICFDKKYTEKSYYRAKIRRCDYSITINGNQYWIAFIGPNKAGLSWQKNEVVQNDFNYKGSFYITRNEETNAAMRRLEVFDLKEPVGGAINKWRITSVDRYTKDGIIEVFIEEWHNDEIVPPEEPEVIIPETPTDEPFILGPTEISKMGAGYKYSIENAEGGTWSLSNQDISLVRLANVTDEKCELVCMSKKALRFDLIYSRPGEEDIKITIAAE